MLNLPWIIAVAFSAILGTLSCFIDNYTADVVFAGKYAQAEKMIFGPLYGVLGVAILVVLRPSFDAIGPIAFLMAAGLVSSLSSIPYCAGLEREETTTAKIFSQMIPVFNLVLAWVFLGQAITGLQGVAFGLMMLAPIVVIASRPKRGQRAGIVSALCFLLYGLASAASSLMFVSGTQMLGDTQEGFLTALALMLIGKSCTDMLLMAFKPTWRKHFYKSWKARKGKLLTAILSNFIIWELADMLYRFSTVSADAVALASVSYETMELIGTFVLGVALSVIWPKFGREKLTKRSVMAHLIATAIATVGIILLSA